MTGIQQVLLYRENDRLKKEMDGNCMLWEERTNPEECCPY